MSTYILLIAVFILLLARKLLKKSRYNLPPGPIGCPIVGYLPFLGKNPAKEFQKLSKKYGDVFSLYLGWERVVVVTEASMAKELLSKPTALDRPEGTFVLLPGGVGFAERNGTEWVEQRRYTMMEMKNLGLSRSPWEKLLEMEVSDFLAILEQSEGKPVDFYKELSASISNNVLSLITGYRLPMGNAKRNIIDQGMESFEAIYDQSGLISHFPKLFRFLSKVGFIEVGEKLNDLIRMSSCLRDEIEGLRKDEGGGSYVHKYFKEIVRNERLKLGNFFNDDNLLGNVHALIMGGSSTTKVSLMWLFLAMASYPDIQDKVQKEVDVTLGKDGKPDWTDRQKLPYCLATINESQRWRTVVPLNLLHRTSEDIVFKGYDIPKNTNILTVISVYHADTRYWENPAAFQPERFLAEDGKFLSEPEGFLPFSYGKRMCPGKTIALIEIFHYFVTIMQKFRIKPANETERLDIEPVIGITLQPKQQPLRFIPR